MVIYGVTASVSITQLFIASGIGKVSIEEISLKAIPFSVIQILAVFIVAYTPGFCLWLPKALGY